MKADILAYLDKVAKTVVTELEREINPSKILQLRAKWEMLSEIANELSRALPDPKPEEPTGE